MRKSIFDIIGPVNILSIRLNGGFDLLSAELVLAREVYFTFLMSTMRAVGVYEHNVGSLLAAGVKLKLNVVFL